MASPAKRELSPNPAIEQLDIVQLGMAPTEGDIDFLNQHIRAYPEYRLVFCRKCKVIIPIQAGALGHWQREHTELSEEQVDLLGLAWKSVSKARGASHTKYPYHDTYVRALPVYQGGYQCAILSSDGNDQGTKAPCDVVKHSQSAMHEHLKEVHGWKKQDILQLVNLSDTAKFPYRTNILFQCFYPGQLEESKSQQVLWTFPKDELDDPSVDIRPNPVSETPINRRGARTSQVQHASSVSRPRSRSRSPSHSTHQDSRHVRRRTTDAEGPRLGSHVEEQLNSCTLTTPARNAVKDFLGGTSDAHSHLLQRHISPRATRVVKGAQRNGNAPEVPLPSSQHQHEPSIERAEETANRLAQIWDSVEKSATGTASLAYSMRAMVQKGQVTASNAAQTISFAFQNSADEIRALAAQAKETEEH